MIKRTKEEIELGVTGGCTRVYRALLSHRVLSLDPATHRGAWLSDDEIVGWTCHANDARKARKLFELCPNLVRRCYYDRKTGTMHDSREGLASPIALYRLADLSS